MPRSFRFGQSVQNPDASDQAGRELQVESIAGSAGKVKQFFLLLPNSLNSCTPLLEPRARGLVRIEIQSEHPRYQPGVSEI